MDEFFDKIELCPNAFGWKADEKAPRLRLVLTKNALHWYQNNAQLGWEDLKKQFLRTFGKNKIDLDIAGESLRTVANEDPGGFVSSVLNYLKLTRPIAGDTEKIDQLYYCLPLSFKVEFVNSMPATVDSFTEKLENINRKLFYGQAATKRRRLHGVDGVT